MSRMRCPDRFVVLAALLAGSTACGDVVRQGRSPVFVVIDSLRAARGNAPQGLAANLLSDVVTNVTQPPPCTTTAPCATTFNDVGEAVLSLAMKNVTVEPTTNNQV